MSGNFVLLTDSSVDLPADYLAKHDVPFASLEYTIDGVSYEDDAGKSMPYGEFYDKIRKGVMSTTTMINIDKYLAFFEPFLKQGKDILYLAFTSALSGSCACSLAAAKELKQAYPEREIAVIDSLCASMGEGLLLHYAIGLRDEGKSLQEVCDWLEQNKQRLNHLFTVDSLMHLYRGGRLSKASAIMGTLIGIKPVLNVSPEGTLVACGKVRGRTQALDRLVSWMDECVDHTEFDMIMISHGDCKEEAQRVGDQIMKKYKVKELLINHVGPVIGSHSGPGTVALFFLGKPRVAHGQ